MKGQGFSLGIDSSTQGTTAFVMDRATFAVVAEAKVRYRDDPRLAGFGLMDGLPLLPPREEGEADQPALLFLAALDAVLADLPHSALSGIAAIDISAQQHGQVWLGPKAAMVLAGLRERGAGLPGRPDLAGLFAPALASGRAPIWMSSNTDREAAELRAAAGGAGPMTSLSGSDSPLRFSGAALRHRALREPASYAAASRIHLISSFLASILSGREEAPIDWGNGAGMSLMDWKNRSWSETLLAAAAKGLPGGGDGLRARLPSLAHPLTVVGRVARYFTERYGIPSEAVIVAGSGDNPQTKVVASGSLLSLGTSFVLMTEGLEPHPSANAMYDGLGRPFLFGCRTNGALSWESLRRAHGLAADDFGASEGALAGVGPGTILRVFQKERESFPESPPVDIGGTEDFAGDYAGAVDSSLGLLWLGASAFAHAVPEIAVTGGAAASQETLKRIAAIWRCRVARIGEAGAAAGAAIAAAAALVGEEERGDFARRAAYAVSGRGPLFEPDPTTVRAYHGEGGYLDRLTRLFELGLGGGKPRPAPQETERGPSSTRHMA